MMMMILLTHLEVMNGQIDHVRIRLNWAAGAMHFGLRIISCDGGRE